ncbi:hypothetical protein WISP_131482 [Willisornis vidua]|uniref:ubiquitinyl hydrolase 1 n=1 Tax=Willisornis vidua TaxID=1566151 RepID=A0ABQ9CPN1_9PASS|nr:hypothetical protein WISP_131482 [Willisornis vidua]
MAKSKDKEGLEFSAVNGLRAGQGVVAVALLYGRGAGTEVGLDLNNPHVPEWLEPSKMEVKKVEVGLELQDVERKKKVTDIELKRLKDAFKRTCGLSYYMTQQCFIREVLGDGVPPKVAEVIYCSFGGISKGLHFNNLIVGLVLLTRGREEEKTKYIFSLFSNESGSYVVRDEMEKMLHVVDGKVPESLRKCFSEGEKVNYEKFRVWLLHNKDAFTFSRWLLSGGVYVTLTDDSDTPTFYQTLAGVTHLEESDIIDLEKRYWLLKAQSRTGRFDLETFAPLVSPPIHPSLSEVCFKVFDVDRDGVLSRAELKDMVVALLEVWKDNRTDRIPELDMGLDEIVEDILHTHDNTKLGHLTLEDYQIWSVKSALANEFLNLLFQVCHIVLGLRPATPEEEGQIIRGWLERESRYGLQPGHNWFLIAMPWWHQWKEYVKYDANPVVIEPSSVLSGDTPFPGSPGSEVCFARQHNTSDNNNQCFLGANGNALLQLNPQKPGAIDNQPLVTQEPVKAASLTMEGGRLKRSPQLVEGKDYVMVPEPVWRALYHWYGANLSLPRPVIKNSKTNAAELELFPRYLLFLRQQPATRSPQPNIWVNMGMMSLRMFPQHLPRGNVPSPNAPLKRVLAYTGCFSRMQTIKEIHEYLSQRLRIKEEDMRLWLYNSENYLTLLDDEDHRLEYLKIQDEQHLVIEVRNKDMSWPEEMSFIANSSKIDRHKVPTEKGATGLSNLGNTCFMNSSIQCVSNTQPLTRYFISGRHLYELNRTNPIGMKGHMAKCYGDLVQELWSGTQKNIAPLKLRQGINHSKRKGIYGNGFVRHLRLQRFCRGCKIECSEDRACVGNAYIAVDWDPTALHLRYQTSQERIVEEHESVEQSRRAQAEPINLDSCLRAFTSEEELGEDEMYYCSKCKTHCLATKKLDLWRLPPILIIHLKRFQFVNGRWIKSQKIVKFPRESFDPSAFLVQRDPSHCQRKVLTLQVEPEPRKADGQSSGTPGEGETLNRSPSSLSTTVLNNVKASPSLGRKSGTSCPSSKNSSPTSSPRTLGRGKGRLRLPQLGKNKLSSSKENLDASRENGSEQEQGEALTKGQGLGGSQGELCSAQDSEGPLANGYLCEQSSFSNGLGGQGDTHSEDDGADDQREDVCANPIYNLYAISCHSGIMGGGHYVTYAKNPNNKWYCYNDSSCKELHPDEIDTDSAYILFYEQQGVDYAQFLPKIDGKKMADTSSMDEDFESDYKKYCVLQ